MTSQVRTPGSDLSKLGLYERLVLPQPGDMPGPEAQRFSNNFFCFAFYFLPALPSSFLKHSSVLLLKFKTVLSQCKCEIKFLKDIIKMK